MQGPGTQLAPYGVVNSSILCSLMNQVHVTTQPGHFLNLSKIIFTIIVFKKSHQPTLYSLGCTSIFKEAGRIMEDGIQNFLNYINKYSLRYSLTMTGTLVGGTMP